MSSEDKILAFAKRVLGLSRQKKTALTRLAARGSDRSYYRLRWDGTHSAILMHYNPERQENTRFVDIAQFLESIGIPTARILGCDRTECFVALEDLGDTDLWTTRQSPWEPRLLVYRETLVAIQKLHSYPAARFPEDRIPLAEPFGPSLYRWEYGYFMEHFVDVLCGIRLKPALAHRIEEETAALAERLSSLPRCLVHRDLQSQNIMVCNSKPFLIDFQGMRFGTHFYDLGSLLYDPYIRFPEGERDNLLRFYFNLSESGIHWSPFRESFLDASVQRLMQALGAYGFLGIRRSLKAYLRHVRPGLENLAAAIHEAGSFSGLEELVSQCSAAIQSSGARMDI